MLAYQLNTARYTWRELILELVEPSERNTFMAGLGRTFNVADVPPNEYEDLPDGKYLIVIEDSDRRNEKNNPNNELISLKLKVQEGAMAGRSFYDNIPWVCENAVRQTIGEQTFASILKAVGKSTVNDTAELHDLFLYVTLTTRKNRKTGELRQHKAYSAYTVAPPTTAQRGAQGIQGRAASPPLPTSSFMQRNVYVPAQTEPAAAITPGTASAPWR